MKTIHSLHDALLWRENRIVSVSEFVVALQLYQWISQEDALMQLGQLIAAGLPIRDQNGRSSRPLAGAVIGSILSKVFDEPPAQLESDQLLDFENLQIFRDDAFKLFADLGLEEDRYPWPYPMEWLTSDFLGSLSPDLEDQAGSAPTKEATDQPPHGNSERFAIIREKILSACLATLAKYPDECKAETGKVVARKLRECMEKHTINFCPDGWPFLQPETIEKLIGRAIGFLDEKRK